MKAPNRYRPRLDRLEDRTCPAVTMHYVSGLLVVSGVPDSGSLSIVETGTNRFSVQDGTATPRSFANVTSLTVSLGKADDAVDINLNGNVFGGTITAAFAGGSNALSVENGTAGALNIHGGIGSNSITLGDGLSTFKVSRNAAVNLSGNDLDTLEVTASTTIVGSLTVSNAATVNLDSGSTIRQSAAFTAARIGTQVTDAATVTLDVTFAGAYALSTGANLLEVDGTVGRNLIFSSPYLNTAGNTVSVKADVGRTVSIVSGGVSDWVNIDPLVNIGGNLVVSLIRGNDQLSVGDGVTIAGGAVIYLNTGTRDVYFGATVGNNTNVLVFAIYGGSGAETVTFSSTATFRGQALVSLSPFNINTVTFASARTFNKFVFGINGGLGGLNTLTLDGTDGSKLFFRNFRYVNS